MLKLLAHNWLSPLGALIVEGPTTMVDDDDVIVRTTAIVDGGV